ncbi:hypothetical protein NLJ89_g11831 [Agrocybe chaxingu]|uniref:Uncharacterized protein n=1 Tax=Agrocybe chaxingu TaxID=84603 RepID=A0A9W8MQT9_9AGAR|nr:hypothetical protein NLJ89_g11831 [Agrocybe chaxingu]
MASASSVDGSSGGRISTSTPSIGCDVLSRHTSEAWTCPPVPPPRPPPSARPAPEPSPGPPNPAPTRSNKPVLATPRIQWPPFPPVPPGATIVPFSQFVEHGIQIFSFPCLGDDNDDDEDDGKDDVERDGLGIPTVPLRVPHETDEGKSEARKKKKEKDRKKKDREGGAGRWGGGGDEEEEGVRGEAEAGPRAPCAGAEAAEDDAVREEGVV